MRRALEPIQPISIFEQCQDPVCHRRLLRSGSGQGQLPGKANSFRLCSRLLVGSGPSLVPRHPCWLCRPFSSPKQHPNQTRKNDSGYVCLVRVKSFCVCRILFWPLVIKDKHSFPIIARCAPFYFWLVVWICTTHACFDLKLHLDMCWRYRTFTYPSDPLLTPWAKCRRLSKFLLRVDF